MMRDCRINLIFEGSSEIMHLFMAREAVDKHLQVAGAMIDPRSTAADKAKALPKILGFYATWYPPLLLSGIANLGRYGEWGKLATHLRFIDRSSRKLARQSFHGMALYQAKMERKQGFLFRAVDIVMELFVMSATLSRAKRMVDDGDPDAERAVQIADLFCRGARRRIKRWFNDLWRNEDGLKNAVAAASLRGEHDWMLTGTLDMGWTPETLAPRSYSEIGREVVEKVRAAAGG
jgi:hypothetical protein